jgi:hypothetical protein
MQHSEVESIKYVISSGVDEEGSKGSISHKTVS